MQRLKAGRRHDVSFTLNGRLTRVTTESRTLLCDLLRHEIGLTGTHVGCEHGVCGGCTIVINGKMARSCIA